MDQKVLKLVAYLHKYTTELHQIYTEYVTTISWLVNVVRMTQYTRGYMTSSFDDVMQQWPGVKNSEIVFPGEVQLSTFMFNVAVIFFEIIMDVTKHYRDQLLSRYAIAVFLPSLIAEG